MEKLFKIGTWEEVSGVLIFTGYRYYVLTFSVPGKSMKINVNGMRTKIKLPIKSEFSFYKLRMLYAIQAYENGFATRNDANRATDKMLQSQFNKADYNRFHSYFDKIAKEESRDRLTKLGLIKFNER